MINTYITEIRYKNLVKGGTSTVNMILAELGVKNYYREVVVGGPLLVLVKTYVIHMRLSIL